MYIIKNTEKYNNFMTVEMFTQYKAEFNINGDCPSTLFHSQQTFLECNISLTSAELMSSYYRSRNRHRAVHVSYVNKLQKE